MGLLQPRPQLEPGETVRWRAMANHAEPTADGLELFVVNKLDERLPELRMLLGRP